MPHQPRQPFDPGPEYAARKRAAGRCICYRCDAPAGKNLPRCYKHNWQRKKASDPIAYIFYHKRQRAFERGRTQPWGNVAGWEPWTLTLENFRDWCLATGYHLKTGRTSGSLSLDRKDNRYGYHVWNIAPLSLGDNSRKHTKQGCWVMENGRMVYREEIIPF